jgi:hypothetical protein
VTNDISFVANRPLLLLALSFVMLWLWAAVGRWFLRKKRPLEQEIREDFDLVLGGSLTLLGLIIGFTFSMATIQYDQRKDYEEQEANAIGTEYLRAGLLPTADAVKIKALLKTYLNQRIQFYLARDEQEAQRINDTTAKTQADLWSAMCATAVNQPTPIVALAASGMNDVLNSQGETQAAWWKRVPPAAWGLMWAIAIGCNLMVGYGSRGRKSGAGLLVILPLVISIAFMLIADIDSPRHGVIRLRPQNLMSTARSLASS